MKRLNKALQTAGGGGGAAVPQLRLEESLSDQERGGVETRNTAQKIGSPANDHKKVNVLQRASWGLCFHSMSLL